MGIGPEEVVEDPGWFNFGKPRSGGIATLRNLFIQLANAGIVTLVVLGFVHDEVGTPAAALAAFVIGLGALGFAGARWSAHRDLDVSSPTALAQSYRGSFFLGYALNEVPLLIGFVLTFPEDALWPYVVVLPLWAAGMYVIAPTRRQLDRRQQEIRSRGSILSLRGALDEEPVRS